MCCFGDIFYTISSWGESHSALPWSCHLSHPVCNLPFLPLCGPHSCFPRRFYSSTMLVLGIKLSSLGLGASTLKPESSPSFSLVPQAILTAGRIQCFSLEGLHGPRDPAKHEGSSLICFALTLRDAPTPCFLILLSSHMFIESASD